jgi:WD40 repeat protein
MKSFEISQEALRFIDKAVFASRNRPLNEGEIFVLEGVWLGLTYVQMVEMSKKRGKKEYKITYLMQSAGPKLFKVLTETFNVEINKTNIQMVIESLMMSSSQKTKDSQEKNKANISGEIPDMGALVGRNKELEQLETQIVRDKKRVIAIAGMGGIGKTHLSMQLIKNLQGKFDFIVWRSLRDAIPLTKLLEGIIQFLSQSQEIGLITSDISSDDRLFTLLLPCLKNKSCLIVLDNLETIFQAGVQGGEYKEGYENYKKFFEIIGQSSHQSCLLITSRETPKEIMHMVDKELPVVTINLDGLSAIDAWKILRSKEIEISDKHIEDLEDLRDKYSGNPFALQQVAAIIKNGVFRNIKEFLDADEVVFDTVLDLLNSQFERLSSHEKDVLFWLSVMREPVVYSELQEDIIDIDSSSITLIDTIRSLTRRSLIEITRNGFTLHSLVMEYVTNKLEEITYNELFSLIMDYGTSQSEDTPCDEIDAEQYNYINRIALLKATSKDYIRETQTRLIIESLIHKLRVVFGDTAQEKIRKVIENLQKINSFHSRPGYLAGNLLNLLISMEGNLEGLNCSNLVVRQAYFKDIILRNMNFSGCDLSNSSFADRLGKVISLKFSPNGEFIWIGNADNIIEIWKVSDGMLVDTLSGHKDWVSFFDFSPNGKKVVSGSKDGVIKIWEIDANKGTAKFIKDLKESGRVQSVVFINDQTIVTATAQGNLNVWDLSKSKVDILGKHSGQMCHLAFCYDTKMLASTDKNCVVFWDMESKKYLRTFPLNDDTQIISALKFSTDGASIATVSDDRNICIWNVHSGECLKRICGQEKPICSVFFIENNSKVVSSSNDETIRIWLIKKEDLDQSDTQTISSLEPRRRITSMDVALDASIDKWIFATGSEDRVLKIWGLNKDTEYDCVRTIKSFNNQIKSISLSSDNKLLATSCEDSKVRIWHINYSDNKPLEIPCNGWIWSITFSPDSRFLAGGGGDNLLHLWSSNDGKSIWSLKGHQEKIFSVAFSNGRVATGSSDKTICLWDIKTGKLLRTLRGHNNRISTVSLSSDSKILASGSYDGLVKVWNVETGECLYDLDMYNGQNRKRWVLATKFNPKIPILATAGDGDNIFIWEVKTGKCLYILKAESTAKIWSLAFSPDGHSIAGGCNDGKIRIWNLETKEIVKSFDVFTSQPSSLAFTNNGDIVTRAIVNDSEMVVVIDCHTEEYLKEFKNPRPYEGLKISNARGLNQSQKECLKALGAIDE